MGSDYTVAHAAVLASKLPPHSRCAVSLDANAAWSDEMAVLEAIDYHLRHLMWMFSDVDKRGPAPKPPRTPAQARELGDQITEAQLNRVEVDRILGIGPS